MLRSVFVLRRIAATHIPANQTQAQVDPFVSGLDALFTNVSMRVFYFYLIQVRAIFSHIISFPMLRGPTARGPLQIHMSAVQSLKFHGAAIESGARRHNSENIHASARNKCPGLRPRSSHNPEAREPYKHKTLGFLHLLHPATIPSCSIHANKPR